MRIAPRTPKAGSSLVSSTMGVADADADEEDVADAEDAVRLGV